MSAVVLNGLGVDRGSDVHLQLSTMGGARPLSSAKPWILSGILLPGASAQDLPHHSISVQGNRKWHLLGADTIQKRTRQFDLLSGISPSPPRVCSASGCCWMLHKAVI